MLECKASKLDEKLLILKMEFTEKTTEGQEKEERLKDKLKDISEELVALKKKRNKIFIEDLEEQSLLKKNSLIKSKIRTYQKSQNEAETKSGSSNQDNRVSIRILGVDLNGKMNSLRHSVTQNSTDSALEANQGRAY